MVTDREPGQAGVAAASAAGRSWTSAGWLDPRAVARAGAAAGVVGMGLLVALTVLVSVDRPGGTALRVGLAGGVVTQTLVCVGVAFGVVAGTHAAGLAPRWVGALGLLSVVAHLLAAVTFAGSGAFALDGPIAAYTPVTTVIWVLALSVALLRAPTAQSGALSSPAVG